MPIKCSYRKVFVDGVFFILLFDKEKAHRQQQKQTTRQFQLKCGYYQKMDEEYDVIVLGMYGGMAHGVPIEDHTNKCVEQELVSDRIAKCNGNDLF